ncbi:MAG: response regulator [Desulfosarcina sp.]|jgi:DNA-binding response OmpR family regulator
MVDTNLLNGKRLLIVDDEPDLLESLAELFHMCEVDTASSFESAREKLESQEYATAVLDIMGVRGHDLLDIAVERDIPAVMLTAHALSADNFIKSMKSGADAYVPKDKISDILFFVSDSVRARQEQAKKPSKWFKMLKPYFDKKFGDGWLKGYEKHWE